ncbi:MAG: hypothetical protein JRJ49_02725, partial [Deltaproteobacteria bacterium]|nr:hypothetical protein [Deltaproteobacteria bacterium]
MADIGNYYSDAFDYLNIDPLVLDLNGDGVKLISYQNSNVVFDVDNDQYAERTGWVSAEDGILVHDKNEDGIINDITETISEYYVENVSDGLQALKTLDSNQDNIFDKNDSMWEILRVWQDANSNGVTDAGELKTLDNLGVQSINLSVEIPDRKKIEGNPVLSRSTMTMTNGATLEVAAVDFTTNPIGYEWNNINLGQVATSENSNATLILDNPAYVKMSELNNITTVYGSAGADTIIGTDNNDWISGGAGSDTLKGGAGNDIIKGGAGDDTIDGGEGLDIAKYKGTYANYDIVKDGEYFKVTDLTTGDADQLKNIERVRFDNVTIWTNTDIFLPTEDIIEIGDYKESIFITAERLLAN